MRKLALALAGAAALTFASAAQATVSINFPPTTVDVTAVVNDGSGSGYINFQKPGLQVGSFTDVLGFHNDEAGLYDMSVLTDMVRGVTFTGLTLSGIGVPGGSMSFDGPGTQGNFFVWDISNLGLDVGDYTITLTGNTTLLQTFQGTVNFGAVPEPATWAMMLIGFGAIGASIRRRRTRVAVRQFA